MAIIYNGTQLTNIKFGDTQLKSVYYCDTSTSCCTLVWTDVDYYLDLMECCVYNAVGSLSTIICNCAVTQICLPSPFKLTQYWNGFCEVDCEALIDGNPFCLAVRVGYFSTFNQNMFDFRLQCNDTLVTIQPTYQHQAMCCYVSAHIFDKSQICAYVTQWMPWMREGFLNLLRCNGY